MKNKNISNRESLDLSNISAEAAYLLKYFAPVLNDKGMRQHSLRIAKDLSKDHKGLYQEYLFALKKADKLGGFDQISSINSAKGQLLTMKSFIRHFYEMLSEHNNIINHSLLDEDSLADLINTHQDNLEKYSNSQLINALHELRGQFLIEILSISGFIYQNHGDSKDKPLIPFFQSFPGVNCLQYIDSSLEALKPLEDTKINRLFFDMILKQLKQFYNYLIFAKRLLIFSRITQDSSYAKLLGHLQNISQIDIKIFSVFKETNLGKQIGPDKFISTGLKLFIEADTKYYVLRMDTPHKGEDGFHINIEQFDRSWQSKTSTANFFINELIEKESVSKADLQKLLLARLKENKKDETSFSKLFQHAAMHIPMPIWDKTPGQYNYFIEDYLKYIDQGSLIYGSHERDEQNLAIIINKSVALKVIRLALNSFLLSGKVEQKIKALVVRQVLNASEKINDTEYLEMYFSLAIENEKDFLLETFEIFHRYIL